MRLEGAEVVPIHVPAPWRVAFEGVRVQNRRRPGGLRGAEPCDYWAGLQASLHSSPTTEHLAGGRADTNVQDRVGARNGWETMGEGCGERGRLDQGPRWVRGYPHILRHHDGPYWCKKWGGCHLNSPGKETEPEGKGRDRANAAELIIVEPE